MSDIAIRFDGLILVGWLIIAASTYVLIAIGAAIMRPKSIGRQARLRLMVRTAFVLSALNLAGLAAVLAYMTYADPKVTGPDWLDWLTIPALVLFTAGCVVLVRRRPSGSVKN